MPTLTLKSNRERSLLRRHPWLFSGAIQSVEGDPVPGETVEVLSSRGEFLARAAYSPQSQISARVWSFDPDQKIDAELIRARLLRAIDSRKPYRQFSNSLRLVHAESDGLPGLIVDQYDETLTIQFLSAGAEFWRETITELLVEITGLATIYERSDVDVRSLEGMQARVGQLHSADQQTDAGNQQMTIQENGLDFLVDIANGHKTGFYLDQRENRLFIRGLAKDRDVLDCFSYTGGFAANALKGGATSVTLIDESADALQLARENLAFNLLSVDKAEFIQADVFKELRTYRDSRRSFDLIILDPPKFAPTKATAERAARGYKDINLLAFKLLRPGGLLATFSCSGGVDMALFQKIVAGAALDAEVDAHVLHRLSQSPDHPVALNFPEGEYLKGLVCQI